MKLTVGIPAYKAKGQIESCLASIYIQTIKDDISVIIASDSPEDNYDYLKKMFPNLDITILECKENTGPGLARQRALDACQTDWITFIDADDVFYTPFALETLYSAITPESVVIQGTFLQEVDPNPQKIRTIPIKNPNHPWVFGRLYNKKFLDANDIRFSELRAMEDGELSWKIRMTVEGTPWKITLVENPVYVWKIGSEHSITRTNVDEKGIAQYNFDLCQVGATIAAIRATKFCKKRNPFNGGIDRFITEMMVDKYFTYIECADKKPIFTEQNLFNAKKFYHECYKEIEPKIDNKILKDIYTRQRGSHANELLGIIPDISFFEFMDKIRTDEYGGEEELIKIRSQLPEDVIENDIKTGVAIF